MERQLKHLEFIQNVINRMAANSFFLKGWSVTLIAALFALAAKDANLRYVFVAYIPVLVFWLLDGYFLWQERLFRGLYNEVRARKVEEIDFSMDTQRFQGEERSWPKAIFSVTLGIFYGSLIATMLVVMFLTK
jgi:hypothetical protein